MLFLIFKILNKKINLVEILTQKLNLKRYLRYIKHSIYFTLWSLNSLIVANVIIQFTAIFIGSVEVAELNIMRMVTNLTILFIGAICHPILPDITRFSSDKDDNLFKKLIGSYYIILTTLTFILVLFLVFFGEIIIKYWVDDNIFNNKVFIFLLLITSLTSFNVQNSNILLVINKHEKYALLNLVNSAIYVLMSYLLMKKFSINGLLFSLIIYEIINVLIVQYLLNFYFSNLRKIFISILILNIIFVLLIYIIPIGAFCLCLIIIFYILINFRNIKIYSDELKFF